MAEFTFYKYHGAGNDFIVIDNRKKIFPVKNYTLIQKLCDRRFGIGADGLLLLNTSPKYDFDMGYHNADGKPGSMCGNGARCIVYFASTSGIKRKKYVFTTQDGLHEAEVISEIKNKNTALVKLKMKDVESIEKTGKDLFLDTGSPHYVKFVNDVSKIDVYAEGKKIRNSGKFKKDGVNVNFVSVKNNQLFIRTYERGVENETFACGTGVTAAAIAAAATKKVLAKNKTRVNAMGGMLNVFYTQNKNTFTDIYLQGEAQMVFEGIGNT
jgi:diaminopimelate epimerase